VNFTREPIIETVITPREGCKLVVRNSKGVGEEYFVDAIEVVSFGRSFFFRSLERPKSFLVPVSDYEVLELKEIRMALKNASAERSIKIGGGRETPVRAQPREEEAAEGSIPMQERKRGRRGRRRRGGGGGSMEMRHEANLPEGERPPEQAAPEGAVEKGAEEVAPSFISKLFPPPPTLIKETLSRYKTEEVPSEEKPPQDLTPPPSEPKEKPEEETKFED
jgi:hypothetical protein